MMLILNLFDAKKLPNFRMTIRPEATSDALLSELYLKSTPAVWYSTADTLSLVAMPFLIEIHKPFLSEF
jgi:hypothetical protein